MIILRHQSMQAHVLLYGATLSGLWFNDYPTSLVLGSPDATAYRDQLTYCGAIVGPMANRIRGGVVTLENKRWHMDTNEGTTSLHSGPNGLHARNWESVEQSDHHVVLRCTLAHGECGLPGERRFEATYRVTDDSALALELSALSDRDTLVNLAHHPYWRLGQRRTVADHQLCITADQFLPVDKSTLPTGEIAPVAGSAYDFRTARAVPVDVTLDANLCLSNNRQRTPQPAAWLSGPDGLTLQIDTTEPGLQVYNGTGLSSASIRLHTGQTLTPYAGIALEPQGWPDAPNNNNFPSIFLPAGEKYLQKTVYRFSKKLT